MLLLGAAVAQDGEDGGLAIEDGGRGARRDGHQLAAEGAEPELEVVHPGPAGDVGAPALDDVERGVDDLRAGSPHHVRFAAPAEQLDRPGVGVEDAAVTRDEDAVGRGLDELAVLLAALAQRAVRALQLAERGRLHDVVGEQAGGAHQDGEEGDAIQAGRRLAHRELDGGGQGAPREASQHGRSGEGREGPGDAPRGARRRSPRRPARGTGTGRPDRARGSAAPERRSRGRACRPAGCRRGGASRSSAARRAARDSPQRSTGSRPRSRALRSRKSRIADTPPVTRPIASIARIAWLRTTASRPLSLMEGE